MTPHRLSDADYDRLARLAAGEGSALERSETEAWASLDAERRAALEAMRLAWRTPLIDAPVNVDAAWGSLSARIRAAESPRAAPSLSVSRGSGRQNQPPERRWWRDGARLMRVAAAAVVLVGGTLVLRRLRPSEGGDSATLASASAVTTAAGERRTVRLADGSTVVLGVSSSLRTRPGYGGTAREVELEGEAYFTVAHDEARPFRVLVNGTIVEDLGTEFAVRSYSDVAPGGAAGAAVRLAVASGSVAVRRGSSSDTAVVLSQRDVATIDRGGTVAVARGVDVDPFTAFAAGRLSFADAPLSDVAGELARWYGVEVRITDAAIADRHLTSNFQGESLDEVLRVIGMTLDVRYTRSGTVVEFTGRGRTSMAPPSGSDGGALPPSLAEGSA